MQEPTHVRAISLILALSVVAGGWLLFEYTNRPSTQAATSPTEILASPSPDLPFPASSATPPSRTPPVEMPSELDVTYKCEKSGKVSFSDKPCAAGTKVLAVRATERQAPRANDNLEQLKRQLAILESYRLEREREYAERVGSRPVSAVSVKRSKEFRCNEIDKEIAAVDSMLRQLHSAQVGDYWTGKRKELTDERFSIRC